MLKKLICLLTIGSMGFGLVGCANRDAYYAAIKSQNETIMRLNQERIEREKAAEREHELRMAELIGKSMSAAAATKDKTDDVLVPVLIMTLEDKRVMAKALAGNKEGNVQLAPVKAPESAGEFIRNSTGALLGVGAIVAGVIQANNMKDIAIAGMNAAGTHNTITGDGNSLTNDSFKSGSQNTVSGDNNNVTGSSANNCDDCEDSTNGFNLDECIANPPGGFVDGVPFWNENGCSCDSHAAGHC